MIIRKTAHAVILLIVLILLATPLSAQRRRPSPPKPQPPAQPAQPAPTFETLLAADSFKIYGEVRGVGQSLRSGGVNDILDPIISFSSPPKEMKTLVKWLTSQADTLATSRLMVVGWPSRPKLPNVLAAIEFASAEEAQKFEPQLRSFLSTVLPAPTPESDSSTGTAPGQVKEEGPKPQPRYILKQAGTLVLISDTQFTFNALRPKSSKLLAEDPNFRQVHDRFSSESVFLYVDFASIEKEQEERIQQARDEEKKRIEAEALNPPKPVESNAGENEVATPKAVPEEPPTAEVQLETGEIATATLQAAAQTDEPKAVAAAGPSPLDLLGGIFFSSGPRWPDAFGLGISFDPDAYVVRALLVNGPESKGSIIPFISQLVAGPPMTPEAPSVLPADTELLITASLDYTAIYEGMAESMSRVYQTSEGPRPVFTDIEPASPFAAYEKRLGIKIKDDLLPLLGNEIAISLPIKTLGLAAPTSSRPAASKPGEEASDQKDASPTERGLVVAVSVKDRDAIRPLLTKIIDSLGFKGASMLAQTEKRGDTELVSYGDALTYAFIGNFLVGSTDSKAVRHVIDSYLNHQTLASDSSFRNYTRWQPRQLLGQVYISPVLMDGYHELAKEINALANDKLRDLLGRVSPTPEAVTYAISNEGLGPLHELHVPRNLVMMMVAGMATASNQPVPVRNEAMAQTVLRIIASAEMTYQTTKGDGKFGTLDQLIENGFIQKDLLEKHGYKIELTLMGDKFEITAVPAEYGKTGKMSYFMDESSVLRGGDHGGGVATLSDKPVQ
jgi:Protein of unknown function (DUF3352)